MSLKKNKSYSWEDTICSVENPSILLLGCRRAGKSQLIKAFLIQDNLLSDCDVVFVYTNTFNREHYINCGVELENIQHIVTAEAIEEVLEFQSQSKKTMLKVCLILDDCFGSRKQKCGKLMDSIEKIWSLGRHMNISIVVAIQDMRYCPLIQNTDIFCFFPNSIRKKSQRKFIKEEILSNYTADNCKIDSAFKNTKHQFTCVHLTNDSDCIDEIITKGKVDSKIVNFKIKKEVKNIYFDFFNSDSD